MTCGTRARASGNEERRDVSSLPEINSTRKNRVFTRQKGGFSPSKSGFFPSESTGQKDGMAPSVAEATPVAMGPELPVGLSARWQTHLFARFSLLEIGLLSCLFQHGG